MMIRVSNDDCPSWWGIRIVRDDGGNGKTANDGWVGILKGDRGSNAVRSIGSLGYVVDSIGGRKREDSVSSLVKRMEEEEFPKEFCFRRQRNR
mmetsp:Transcript_1983/g.4547  ORF Transcript_1983/g.4547 Transcript_1983/m.4547 type:complete len:93 (+) Transcript_1983:1586-1864(+)